MTNPTPNEVIETDKSVDLFVSEKKEDTDKLPDTYELCDETNWPYFLKYEAI